MPNAVIRLARAVIHIAYGRAFQDLAVQKIPYVLKYIIHLHGSGKRILWWI